MCIARGSASLNLLATISGFGCRSEEVFGWHADSGLLPRQGQAHGRKQVCNVVVVSQAKCGDLSSEFATFSPNIIMALIMVQSEYD